MEEGRRNLKREEKQVFRSDKWREERCEKRWGECAIEPKTNDALSLEGKERGIGTKHKIYVLHYFAPELKGCF